MRLEWLEDILAVHDTGSFAAAAEARFLTPSAFTRRVRSIEESLGCELFDRRKKPIVLHHHALENLESMRETASSLKQLKMQLSESDTSANQNVSIMCQHVLSALLAPEIIKLVNKEQVSKVRVKSGRRNDCLLSLFKKEVQFALTYEEVGEKPLFDPSACGQLFLGYETYIPVAKVESNPSLQQQIDGQSFLVINYPSSVYLGEVQQRHVFSNINPNIRLQKIAESGLVLAVAEFVKHGIGVGWLPKSLVAGELERGELINLEHILPKWRLNIKLTRFIGRKPPQAECFWQVIRNHFVVDNGRTY